MTTVTKENLIAQIDRLHKIKDEQGQLSMNGEYTLQAYEMLLATMGVEPVEMPLDYLQGHKDGLEWAAQLAEANHPETGDWLYDDPIELAKAIRKGPDMPPAQPAADSEPVALHMGEAINVFNALKIEQLSEHVNNARLGPMGAINVQVWTSKAGGRLEFISANGGCTLNIFPHPAPVVPDEMTPEMMRAVQLNSELGAYAAANLSGAYGLFAEFWKVACRAAMLAAAKQEVK